MKKTTIFGIVFLMMVLAVFAIDFTPKANVNGQNRYNITDFITVNATYFIGNGSQLTSITVAQSQVFNFTAEIGRLNTTVINLNSTKANVTGGNFTGNISTPALCFPDVVNCLHSITYNGTAIIIT